MKGASSDNQRNVWNQSMSLSVDLFGGAITDFHLRNYRLNPLSFRFSKDQMPVNNREGAVYQGHFLCLGRWGSPSAGEINAGMPNHGQFANILWTESNRNASTLEMQATGNLEGLSVHRSIKPDAEEPVYMVRETVTNFSPLGRMYNMVQHPTISSPFLDVDVLIDSNATEGFDYSFDDYSGEYFSQWPHALSDTKKTVNLSSCTDQVSSVFSFIVDPESPVGWITAYSPSHELLFGYIWKRGDYPWINHWLHCENEQMRYRGLEFGTTGIHKPFDEVLSRQLLQVLGERTYDYLDAGASRARSYISFLKRLDGYFNGVASIEFGGQAIRIVEKETLRSINIPVSLKF